MPDVQAIDGRRRVAIENVRPIVDNGRFAIKRTVGQTIVVSADVFADGHDSVRAVLLSRLHGEDQWQEAPMTALGNDCWQGEFKVAQIGRYEYSVQGWVDGFDTWRYDLKKRIEAGQNVSVDLRIGAQFVGQVAERASGQDAVRLRHWQTVLADGSKNPWTRDAEPTELIELMSRNPDRRFASQYEPPLAVVVDSDKSRFSTWYELFPRSCAAEPDRHGTFRDCIDWLPRLARMGFDVLYLPPIHPIGTAFRKGKNNAVIAEPGAWGCPWAIGSSEGGHTAVHPQLGTLAELHQLISACSDCVCRMPSMR